MLISKGGVILISVLKHFSDAIILIIIYLLYQTKLYKVSFHTQLKVGKSDCYI